MIDTQSLIDNEELAKITAEMEIEARTKDAMSKIENMRHKLIHEIAVPFVKSTSNLE